MIREFTTVFISHFHVLLDQHKGYKRGAKAPNCEAVSENLHALERVSWPNVMSWCHDALWLTVPVTLDKTCIRVSGLNFSCYSSYRLCWVADWSHFLTYYHSNWFSPSVNSFLMGPISYILSSHSPRHQSLINKHSNQKSRHPQSRVIVPRIFIHSINCNNKLSYSTLRLRTCFLCQIKWSYCQATGAGTGDWDWGVGSGIWDCGWGMGNETRSKWSIDAIESDIMHHVHHVQVTSCSSCPSSL